MLDVLLWWWYYLLSVCYSCWSPDIVPEDQNIDQMPKNSAILLPSTYGSSFLRETFIAENDCHSGIDRLDSVDPADITLREKVGSLDLLRPLCPLPERMDLSPPELLRNMVLVKFAPLGSNLQTS
uniref:Uncharacterized protein n=1 Tax=Skeletonema marinoi TaxID=267567 RepID=A0A7S2PBR0_9STRA|mmetsp:Transcript_17270/g.29163  ORF Transcript_17270/g.29163 Transcript_17270/m.29163 type:complete len:125 (+) Transcript_17270:10-384(+)